MNEEQFIKDFESRIQRVVEADNDNFFELVKILGLDLITDFAGADLSQISLREGNLKGANFQGTDLSGSDLSYADLSNADLRNTNLSYANLSGANLSSTNLGDASVEYAIFSNNRGVSQSMKLNLFHRGATIETSHPEMDETKQKQERIIDEPIMLERV